MRAALAQAAVQLSIFKMIANAETCFIALTRLGGTILARQKLGAKLRELASLMLAKIEGGDCEWMQHVPIATSVGVTPAQADAIAQQSVGSPCFSDVERTVLRSPSKS